MSSQNYKVAGQRVQGGVGSGLDLYKPSFSATGETTYIWRQVPQSLKDIMREETVPLVVKLNHDNTVRDDATPIDLQQPLLLYKELKTRKLHARNLRSRDSRRESAVVYQTVGPYVTFPDNFVGYFRPMDMLDKPLELVADVARFMPKALISKTAFEGFACVSDIGETIYQKGMLPPGLYHPLNILEETITYLNKRKSEKKKLVRCLACHDVKDKPVLFPLDQKGHFYLAEPKSKSSKQIGNMIDKSNRAFKWTEFDQSALSGYRVRMVYGTGPTEECRFTGAMELSHVTEEHTVVGCTMTSEPRLFEMAVTSEPFFIVALNSDDLDGTSLQQRSLKFAKNECDAYIQCAKVKRDYDIEENEAQ